MTNRAPKIEFCYCLSCYSPKNYFFAVPLRASEAWLKKTLHRKSVINAEPLKKNEFDILKKRLPPYTEIPWRSDLQYVVEGIYKTKKG